MADQNNLNLRIVVRFPFDLAPYKVAILPLVKKDGLDEVARNLFTRLRKMGILADYDQVGSIGKRYRRQDENGTPWCVTIDYQTLEDGTVTIRHRDKMSQERIPMDKIGDWLRSDKFQSFL